ncbi:MAG: hypothetical protein NTZ83_02010, partial [Candidatus Pacearchaeota archaeon]|nr:hypothetical protein [Candidatus Pacearchaeota archaeon]
MRLFIFGSTGDLVKRKILPALHEFEDLNVYVLGRKKLNNGQYNEEYCKTCSEKFKLKLNYLQISFEESICSQLNGLLDKEDVNSFYISMPPSFTIDILNKIIEIKKNGFKIQVLIEKSFGSNLKEAEILAKMINKKGIMEEVYLADHYLFKKSILHLNLNKTSFTKLRLVSLEKIGLEGRTYYDSVGALRDMVQSHFFNILHKLVKFSAEEIKITEF